ncbi:hypothetical protein pb186bvf_005803 [Paramecium bursaria]
MLQYSIIQQLQILIIKQILQLSKFCPQSNIQYFILLQQLQDNL